MIPNDNNVFLSVRDLKVVYTARKKIVHAVNGVSFDMLKGETLGLVGETGAGKTTIAKSILRVLPNPPAKVLGGEIPYPGGAVADHHFLSRPVPTALRGFAAEASSKSLRRFDAARIGRRAFLPPRSAVGVHGGLREDAT